jgi:TrmH family RNA methyltransferase
MVVKSELKLIKSLHQKKYRNEHGLFIIEGKKAVEELLRSKFKVFRIYVLEDVLPLKGVKDAAVILPKEMNQISSLKNPNGVVGVFYIPKAEAVDFSDWIIVLDDVQDPGNLGTIIRLCDWFGIPSLVCSENTVDCYNPKVLQATMGSIARVNISYTSLDLFLSEVSVPVYGSFMDGNNVYKEELPKRGILIMGNEGKGISDRVKRKCENRITIPRYGKSETESLNVATAAAILMNEIRRA